MKKIEKADWFRWLPAEYPNSSVGVSHRFIPGREVYAEEAHVRYQEAIRVCDGRVVATNNLHTARGVMCSKCLPPESTAKKART